MIAKRIIGVVTIRDGWAVQSFGYGRYLPLGRPELLIENLDRWGVDEILVQCIDRTIGDLGPDFALIDQIAACGISTPLVYGGGLRSADDAVAVVTKGADRVVCDAIIRDRPGEVVEIARRLGSQALVGCLPMSIVAGHLRWRDYRTTIDSELTNEVAALMEEGVFSEMLLVDWRHEGVRVAFDSGLLDVMPGTTPLIAFGGVSEPDQIEAILGRPRVAAVAIGNFLSYREHAVQKLREKIAPNMTRPAIYTDHSN